MEFRVLGPLEVLDGRRTLPLGGAKQRVTLAILLLHRNEAVSRARLVEGVWGDSPPASAAHSIESYISRLRKVLGEGDTPARLLTRSPGYLLRVDEGELDLQRLEALMDQGRRALSSGDPSAAASAFREGLALFRGAPLEDLQYAPFHRAEVGHLDDLRLAAIELRIDAELALGEHSDVIGELSALIAKHPLRERFWEQLMLALYRSGRQGEALATFDRVRRHLAEELGVDPGHSLRQLHRRMLRQDPVLEPPGSERLIELDSAERAARAADEPATGDPERRSLTTVWTSILAWPPAGRARCRGRRRGRRGRSPDRGRAREWRQHHTQQIRRGAGDRRCEHGQADGLDPPFRRESGLLHLHRRPRLG